MYLEYLQEEEGKKIIETEDGFIAYLVMGKEFYISRMFIKKESRGPGSYKELGELALKNAEANGCTHASLNVQLRDPERDSKKLIYYSKMGFRPISANNNIITMIKDIDDEKLS